MSPRVPVGTDRKKLIFLGVVLLGAAYSIYTNVLTDPELPAGRQSSSKGARPTSPQVAGLPQPPSTQAANDRRLLQRKQTLTGKQSGGEFKISLKYAKPEDRPDPMKVDPTLRLDLLAKLQNVTLEGGHRSLFEFGNAPPPKPTAAELKIAMQKKDAALAKAQTTAVPTPKPADAGPPKAPPIPLKFYGFTTPRTGGIKRGFFLEGEDIHVAAEGETIKRRYKVIRIQVNSVVMEDTQFSQQQTLPLEEPPVTG